MRSYSNCINRERRNRCLLWFPLDNILFIAPDVNNNDDNDDDNNGNNNENQNHDRNNHNQVSEDDEGSTEAYDDFNYGNKSKDNHENNHYSEDEEDNDENIAEPENDDQDTNDDNQPEELTGRERRRSRRSMHHSLPGGNGELGRYWTANAYICPIVGAMVVAKQA